MMKICIHCARSLRIKIRGKGQWMRCDHCESKARCYEVDV